VSSRHSLKAARLLAALMADPRLPQELLNQSTEYSPDVCHALEVSPGG